MPIEPQNVEFETKSQTKQKDGSIQTTHTKVSWDTIDSIAVAAGLVALLVVIGFMSGWIPINKMTIGLASLSALAGIVMGATRNRRKDKSG